MAEPVFNPMNSDYNPSPLPEPEDISIITELDTEIDRVRTNFGDKLNNFKSSIARITTSNGAFIDSLNGKIQEITTSIGTINGKISTIVQSNADLQGRIDMITQEKEAETRQSAAEISRITEEKNVIRAELDAKITELNQHAASNASTETDRDEKHRRVQELEGQITSHNDNCTQRIATIKTGLMEKLAELDRNLDMGQTEFDLNETKISSMKDTINNLITSVNAMKITSGEPASDAIQPIPNPAPVSGGKRHKTRRHKSRRSHKSRKHSSRKMQKKSRKHRKSRKTKTRGKHSNK